MGEFKHLIFVWLREKSTDKQAVLIEGRGSSLAHQLITQLCLPLNCIPVLPVWRKERGNVAQVMNDLSKGEREGGKG